jgi:hypothetical protein
MPLPNTKVPNTKMPNTKLPNTKSSAPVNTPDQHALLTAQLAQLALSPAQACEYAALIAMVSDTYHRQDRELSSLEHTIKHITRHLEYSLAISQQLHIFVRPQRKYLPAAKLACGFLKIPFISPIVKWNTISFRIVLRRYVFKPAG